MSPPRRGSGAPAAGEGLFDAGAEARLAARGPLAHRMRPRTLNEVVGQVHLVGPGAPLRVLIETDRLSSAVLWGPPGTGKTTLARLVAETTGREFVPLSAVSAGVADVRRVLEEARRRLGERGQGTILFLDFTTHSLGVRLVRSRALRALWDTPLRDRCTSHSWRGRPSGATRKPPGRATLMGRARHGHRVCSRPG